MGTNTGHVMTLSNSIIGVSVLAMPFCYKQCGIVLASLMLIISCIMSRLACYYLIKSATLARRRNFEFLAFHTFGPTGKLTVELSIIGFMLGTCVAFFVVMGDLGPAILGPLLNIENPSTIRASVLIALAMLVVLPLGLLRNVDSLAAISTATIAFYICLVLKVMGEATTHLLAWDWLDKVYLWRPAGLLQCIPIFSMALSCQTQLFEIFDSIQNATLDKMTVIVGSAVNLCTLMYMAMGFFGYIAFCTQPFSGNLMLSFSPTPTSEVIKMGFVLSIAVSFPLVIFPCRASLHSLLFRRGIPPHQELQGVTNHMTETRFKCLTLAIVAVSLVTGILIPNIELVLGLVGSTIGVLICIIMPATLFLCLTTKNNNERLLAQVLCMSGLLIMVLGSYANLYATEEVMSGNEAKVVPPPPPLPPQLPTINLLPPEPKVKAPVQIKDDTLKDIKNVEQLAAALPKLIKETPAPVVEQAEQADVRKEPPVPEAPVVKVVSETPVEEQKLVPAQETKKEEPAIAVEKPAKKEEVIHGDALKKEDDEIKEVQKQEILKKKEELIEKLEENEQKQQKLLEEQKKILEDIKLEKEKLVEENKQLKEVEKESPVKLKPEKSNVENEVINYRKDKDALQKNMPVVEDSKPLNKIENLKDNLIKDSLVKDNIVKKNMANGVPLPIAAKLMASPIEGMKSVNIVDNPSNPNEGNADSKMLRRDILGENVVEQREKRDVTAELGNILDKINKKDNVHDENVQLNIENANVVTNSEASVTAEKVTSENELKEAKKDVGPMDVVNNIDLIRDKEVANDQCIDETKAVDLKFKDSLKPLNEEKDQPKMLELPVQVKSAVSTKQVATVEETKTESIIKTPAYLSNPGLVLPAEKLEPVENNVLNTNVVKPMKRDLKSFDMTQQKNAKDSET